MIFHRTPQHLADGAKLYQNSEHFLFSCNKAGVDDWPNAIRNSDESIVSVFISEKMFRAARSRLRMICRSRPQIGVEEWLARGLRVCSLWLDRHKHSIDVFERGGVVGLECPTTVGFIVHVENPEVHRMGLILRRTAPHLNGLGVAIAGQLVQVEGVEDQRLPFGIETRPKVLRFVPLWSTSKTSAM